MRRLRRNSPQQQRKGDGTNVPAKEPGVASTNRPPEPFVWHDPWVYRLAVGGVGLALIAFLIAGAVIGASGHAKEMVAEYWTIGASLAGALVGIIAPSPRQKKEAAATQSHNPKGGYGATVAQPVLLIAALGATLWLATEVNAADAALLRTLAAGSAGALIGLLVPSPGSDLKQ